MERMANDIKEETGVKWPDKLTGGILRRSGADQPQTPWRIVLEVNSKVFNPEDLPGATILVRRNKAHSAIVLAAVREGWDVEYVDDKT